MLVLRKQGLYCPAGDFYIDPSHGVERAVITHAHSDHARRGSRRYDCADSGVGLLKVRLGGRIPVEPHVFGEPFCLNEVRVSFHPAGHILGSAQVRLEHGGQVWVVSGDYKREPDPTCEPFEPVPCDVFVTEATFGTPAYVWPEGQDLGLQILEWWERNRERDVNSVLFAYSLGKAQRVLGVLHGRTARPVHCDPAVSDLNACYRAQGVRLAPTVCLSELAPEARLRGELLLVPPSFLRSAPPQLLGGRVSTAFASGWMAQDRGWNGDYDQGFVMSDHADWKALVRTVQETGARRVYVQHRGKGALVKHLRTLGLQAFPDSDLREGNLEQLDLGL